MCESDLIPVSFLLFFFTECVPRNPGFAWSGPNFRFASVEDFGGVRLTQFPAPFLWLALSAAAPRPCRGGQVCNRRLKVTAVTCARWKVYRYLQYVRFSLVRDAS